MRRVALVLFFLLLPGGDAFADPRALSGNALEVFRRAQNGRWFSDAVKLSPEILPTSDGQSFLAVWKAPKSVPKRWIASLHGSKGFATDDLALWHPHIRESGVGLLCVQWWIGTDDSTRAYYSPPQIYREIDLALKELRAQPGTVLFHGFSRGSANSYAVTALDRGRGRRYFSLSVASSGGVGLDYPPTRAILEGRFGRRPLQGTRWIIVAGARDPNPERDGIPGMRRTATWLREQGATVILVIEDPVEGHGALMRNRKNVRIVLKTFLDAQRP